MLIPKVLPGSRWSSTSLGGPHVWLAKFTSSDFVVLLGEACGGIVCGGGDWGGGEVAMGDTDFAGEEGVEEALPSEVTLARPVRGLNVELEKRNILYFPLEFRQVHLSK